MPISEQEQRELEAEFEADLDDYMEEWTAAMLKKFSEEEDSPSAPASETMGA